MRRFIKNLLKVLAFLPYILLFPTRVIGKKNIAKLKGNAIYACNHLSNLDTAVIELCIWGKNFAYLSKKEMSKHRFSRWFFTLIGSIFIDRKNTDIAAMRKVLATLKNNRNLIIFPEGTRNKTGSEEMQTMKSGTIFFASKADSYIVPMQLQHKPRIFRLNRLYIGTPYKVEDKTKDGINKELEKLESKFEELRNAFPKPKLRV